MKIIAILTFVLFLSPVADAFCAQMTANDVYRKMLQIEQENKQRHIELMATLKYNGDKIKYMAETNDCNCEFYFQFMAEFGETVQGDKIAKPADRAFAACLTLQGLLRFVEVRKRYEIFINNDPTIGMHAYHAWKNIRNTPGLLDDVIDSAKGDVVKAKDIEFCINELDSMMPALEEDSKARLARHKRSK